jgi:hypothetical protein
MSVPSVQRRGTHAPSVVHGFICAMLVQIYYPDILQTVLQQIVLETLVVILGWRYSRYDPARARSNAQAAAIHDTSCQ